MSNRLSSELATLFGSGWLSDCVVRFYLEDGDDGVVPRSASRAAGFAEDDAASRRFLGAPLPAHLLVLYCGSERFQAQIERWHESLATAAPADRFATTASVWALGRPTSPLRTSTSAPTLPSVNPADAPSTTPTADCGPFCPFHLGQESLSLPCLTGLSLSPQQEVTTQTALPAAAPAAAPSWRGSMQGRPHTAEPQAVTSPGPGPSAALQPHLPRLPELLVPLGSADELEPSLAALRFLYTRTLPVSYRSAPPRSSDAVEGPGQEQDQGLGRTQQQQMQPPRSNNGGQGPRGGLPVGSGHGSVVPPEAAAMGVRDLLMLRRQGSYLRISGCVGACDTALANIFHDALAALLTSSTSNTTSTGGAAVASPPAPPYDPLPPVRELYDSRDLLPCRTADPGVGAVLDAALQLLLASFRRNPHPHAHASDRGHVPNGTPGPQPDANLQGAARGHQQQQQAAPWGVFHSQQQQGQQQQQQLRQLGTTSGGSSVRSGPGSGSDRAAGSGGSRGDLLVWLMGGDALGIANDPHRCVREGGQGTGQGAMWVCVVYITPSAVPLFIRHTLRLRMTHVVAWQHHDT